MVERVKDPEPGVQKLALESMRWAWTMLGAPQHQARQGFHAGAGEPSLRIRLAPFMTLHKGGRGCCAAHLPLSLASAPSSSPELSSFLAIPLQAGDQVCY